MDKIGIQNLKEAVSLGLSIGELVDGCFNGIGADDAVKLVEVVQKVSPAYDGYKEILPEYADLDAEEKQELKKFIEDDFDISSDSIESIIEVALKLVIDLSAIIGIFKKSK